MLNQDIVAAIEKNLSAEVSNVLKVRLEMISQLEKTNKNLQLACDDERTKHNAAKKLIDEQQKELAEFRAQSAEFKSADKNIKEAQMKAAIAEAKLAGAMEVTHLVFANNLIKTRVNGNIPVASANPNQYNSNVISTERTVEG